MFTVVNLLTRGRDPEKNLKNKKNNISTSYDAWKRKYQNTLGKTSNYADFESR